jgi:hypothetical protein
VAALQDVKAEKAARGRLETPSERGGEWSGVAVRAGGPSKLHCRLAPSILRRSLVLCCAAAGGIMTQRRGGTWKKKSFAPFFLYGKKRTRSEPKKVKQRRQTSYVADEVSVRWPILPSFFPSFFPSSAAGRPLRFSSSGATGESKPLMVCVAAAGALVSGA